LQAAKPVLGPAESCSSPDAIRFDAPGWLRLRILFGQTKINSFDTQMPAPQSESAWVDATGPASGCLAELESGVVGDVLLEPCQVMERAT
jgi:hypothetical protein